MGDKRQCFLHFLPNVFLSKAFVIKPQNWRPKLSSKNSEIFL